MIPAAGAGRRRGVVDDIGGVLVSLPAADVAAHGAGYPLTYRFAVGAGPVSASFRTSGAWQTIPAAPAGRWDGIDALRVADGVAYVSKSLPAGATSMQLRVTDGAGDAEYLDVAPLYDGRTTALVFTYDDTPHSSAEHVSAITTHQAAKLWMSPGYNMGTFNSSGYATALIGDGYIEPSNHTLLHQNAALFTSQGEADDDYLINRAQMISKLPFPPQSRGRVLSAIYPFGSHNAYTYEACRKAGHLTARLIQSGSYASADWDATYQMVTQQPCTVAMGNPGNVSAAVAAVDYALSNSLPMVHLYGYSRYFTWGAGDPWPLALASFSAMSGIWSVGYGHHALYRRTRDRITVATLTP